MSIGTLQELLGPRLVEFWSRDRHFLGSKESLEDLIVDITGIPIHALRGTALSSFTINERFRWAAQRQTKRPEDKAYCLLGIFGIFLSPIYGEDDHAFIRLQEEVQKRLDHVERDPKVGRPPYHANDEGHRQNVLASLAFEQMDARHFTIKDAQRTTCEWILKHPDYLAWDDRESTSQRQGVLWIAGKPGAGKSTLMKFALGQAKKSKYEDDVILSFFFNARGDDLERTTLGMYRGLLIQLLEAAPDLRSVLDSCTEPCEWTLNILQDLLLKATQLLGRRRLRIFVDALDECDEPQVRDMIDFFEDLSEDLLSDGTRVDVCYASRHYPSIVVRHGWRVVLEEQAGHTDDLNKYIERRLRAGKGRMVDEIKAEIQEKANGVFMWVVLVVEILNEEFGRGRIFAVRRRLEKIPPKLSDLFTDLLRRDNVNMDDLLLCLQWILFAKRPLRREEFYFAMEAGLHHDLGHDGGWRPEQWDPQAVTTEDMNKFVLSSSKGLAELTKSRKAPTVQFIHESVRDFLIKDGGLCNLWPTFEGQVASLSHDKLKKCCLE